MGCKTLFVIGNGFDLYHGVRSRYEDFHKWLIANRGWSRFEDIEQHFIVSDLWSNLEENLGAFDSEGCGEDWSIATPLGMFINGQLICTAREVNEDFDGKLREWRDEMLRGLAEWVKTLRPVGGCPKLPIVSTGAQYLSFNYTRTLEDYYGIDPYQILHVHGVAGQPWKCLQLGHGAEIEEIRDDNAEDYNPECFDGDQVTPVEELNGHVRRWRKPVEEIIRHHVGFWNGLGDVAKVIVLGFSMGRVDEPYMRKIANVVRRDVVWWCSWHDKGEDIKTRNFLMSVGERHIELFRLEAMGEIADMVQGCSN